MKRGSDLSKRLQEVLLNGHWVANTNFKEQIQSVTWKQACIKPMNLNSIAELTFHVNYYLAGILNVFEGGKLEIRDKYSFDLEPITSEADWKKLVETFISNSEAFVSHVESMRDEKLDSLFVDERYGTFLRNIEGVIEHSYYHLGQISLIKKIIGHQVTE